uniref:Uncharacterized protein n=1 Tax=Oryza brachyantha TaxID=4533 RepID=J3L4B5_ORYBR
MACARKMVDDQIGMTRTADLSCSTWSTVHSRPRSPKPSPSAPPLLGLSSFVLLIMHALFKNLNRFNQTSPLHHMNSKVCIFEQQFAPLASCIADPSIDRSIAYLSLSVGTVSLQSLR